MRQKLDPVLKQLGIQNLIVTGCTTSVCVESTIRDAYSNYDATLVLVRTLFGWVSDSRSVTTAMEARKLAIHA